MAVAGAARAVVATVPCLWPGATVVCIGGGASLTPVDVNHCRGRARVIAINNAYQLAPWADVLYGCDGKWWKWHQGVPGFTGLKYAMEGYQTQKARRAFPDLQVLRNGGELGLTKDRSALTTGRNSGYQAINLAVHLGATRILLLGYDMQRGPKGQAHWFGNHPDGHRPPFSAFRRCFESIREPLQRAGVTVLNCSRQTALRAFPRVTLEEALA